MSRMSMEERKKKFVKIFKELAYSRSSWEVWSDVITVIAITISNTVDRSSPRWEEREHEYMQLIKRLGGNEKPAKIFAEIVGALEDDPDQDFLGQLYMQLELGNHWKGQFFTPYNISSMMSQMSLSGAQNEIENKGWISICDPCVGGGAMLIAARNVFARNNINFSNHVLFVGQDIDRVVGLMAYIQIALLGCPGYIVIAALNRAEKMRPEEKIEKKDFYFIFELKKEESING